MRPLLSLITVLLIRLIPPASLLLFLLVCSLVMKAAASAPGAQPPVAVQVR